MKHTHTMNFTDSEIISIKTTLKDGLKLARAEMEQVRVGMPTGSMLTPEERRRIAEVDERLGRALFALSTFQKQIDAIQ